MTDGQRGDLGGAVVNEVERAWGAWCEEEEDVGKWGKSKVLVFLLLFFLFLTLFY